MSSPSNIAALAAVVNAKPVDPKVINSRIDGVLESLNALTSDDLSVRIKALDAQRAALTSIRNALAAKEHALTEPRPENFIPTCKEEAPAKAGPIGINTKEKQR